MLRDAAGCLDALAFHALERRLRRGRRRRRRRLRRRGHGFGNRRRLCRGWRGGRAARFGDAVAAEMADVVEGPAPLARTSSAVVEVRPRERGVVCRVTRDGERERVRHE